ncbi:hypothetical protein CAEBREN_03151 [Caenorhabditis brenneri]|uniref:Uncharacterized protein n=1 Tax=Caenorhabditis brenneri TaxID=135651 RepID=G0NEV1_CAEBE|nr:hypothetical protein CAEBREN_03151 [Caenorhabditis brenneri]
MGLRSSKTAPEHTQNEEDRHSAWGSEIDRSLCGPGTICEDDWTPMNSLPPTPESQRRKISEMRIKDEVITEQPGLFENFQSEEDNMTNFDVMTVHEIDGFSPIMVAPVTVPAVIRKKKRKIRKRRVKKKSTDGRKKKSRRLGRKSLGYSQMELTETPVLRSYNKSIKIHAIHGYLLLTAILILNLEEVTQMKEIATRKQCHQVISKVIRE